MSPGPPPSAHPRTSALHCTHLTLTFPLPCRSPQRDNGTLDDFEQRSRSMGGSDERDRLLEEMRRHTEALAKQRKHEAGGLLTLLILLLLLGLSHLPLLLLLFFFLLLLLLLPLILLPRASV